MTKVTTLTEAIHKIPNGSTVAIGGNVLHRAPMALVRELARQEKQNLALVKTAGAMDIDLLCFAGCASSVDAGFISYETKFGLANHYRKGVQDGQIKGNEHACYTVISALRAAQAGIPFMPVAGLTSSDLIQQCDYFSIINDPFSGKLVTVVQAIAPDFALLHVHKADTHGNAIITQPCFEDALIARASGHVIVTAEEVVSPERMRYESNQVNIPSVLVDAVVPLPSGARPCSCWPLYDIAEREIQAFKELRVQADLRSWLKQYERNDYAQRGGY